MELVKALEVMLGDLKDERIPAPSMVESLLEQFEDNELKAEALDHVVTRRQWEGEGHDLLYLTSDGRLRLRKTRTRGHLPTGTEELRTCFRIIDHAWLMAKLHCPGKAFLAGYGSTIWVEHSSETMSRGASPRTPTAT
jgi:hypothetical protein